MLLRRREPDGCKEKKGRGWSRFSAAKYRRFPVEKGTSPPPFRTNDSNYTCTSYRQKVICWRREEASKVLRNRRCLCVTCFLQLHRHICPLKRAIYWRQFVLQSGEETRGRLKLKFIRNSIISTTSNVSPVSPDLTSDYWYLVLIKRKRRRLVIHILFFFQFKQMNVNPESGSQRIPKRRSSHYRERFHGYLWETVFRDQRYVLIVKRAVTPLYVLSLFSL